MANSASVGAYLHIEGFDEFMRDAFNKSKIRAGMRKAGKLVIQQAQLNLALARGSDNYPVSRTGRTVSAIKAKVSRSGFLVKVAPFKTAQMRDYYPAYLHYGVKQGMGRNSLRKRSRRERVAELASRAGRGWRIAPRANYMEDALQDKRASIQTALQQAFAAALR